MKMLITGATGMVGSAVAQQAIRRGYQVRVLVRPQSDRTLIRDLDVETVPGDLSEHECFPGLLDGIDVVVHSGAHIGDWGPADQYRAINVIALEHLLIAASQHPLKRWIQISSLGVYPARDHYGTDESVPPDLTGLDGYTRSKAEAEVLLNAHIERSGFPAAILRPGFIYGVGERHAIPRLIKRFESGVVKFIGDGNKVLNNTYVGNLVDAVFLAIDNANAVGQTFNIRDARLVTREEYLMTVAEYLGKPRPGRIPLWLARAAVPLLEGWAKLRQAPSPPLLTRATIKFMALNLDYSIAKAERMLAYHPATDFQQGIREALDWARERRVVTV